MIRRSLTYASLFIGLAASGYAANSDDQQALKKNIKFLKNILHNSTKLHHTHEHSKDFSLLSSESKHHFSGEELKNAKQWLANIDLAEKALIKAFRYRSKSIHSMQYTGPDEEAERKAYYLAKRSLILSAKTLRHFTGSKLKRKIISKKDTPSFQEIADAAYDNIQKIKQLGADNAQ